MMLKPNILLVDESPVYGGHEAMLMAFLKVILPQLLSSVDVDFIINANNQKLIDQLKQPEFKGINVHSIILTTLPIKPITQFLLRGNAAKLRHIIKKVQPIYVLNIQGTIEIGCPTLLLCKSLNVPVLSYLPITKSSAKLGVFLGRVRDAICKYFYYSVPRKIITISESNSHELQSIFSVSPKRIAVVHNFVESVTENTYNALPKFLPNKTHLALVGRISNTQKQQFDFLAAWLASNLANDYIVHVVGDNDDKTSQQLRELCTDAVESGYVVFHGWQSPEYVSQVIKQCNALLLPSRFEGVPLVMIEAIMLGCVVIGSAVDGMKEFLPSEWTFELNDWQAMFKIIKNLNNVDQQALLMHKTQQHFSAFNKDTNTQKLLTILIEELESL